MEKITPELFLHDGTCSTYMLRRGGRSLLIDCGQWTPDQATEAGGESVDRLLLTHFHRDQCGAAPVWAEAGVRVGYPAAEKRFFEEGDLLRAGYDTYDNYTAYYPTRGPLEDVVGESVLDYSALEWEGVRIEAVPLPGHTFGSLGYFFELDGARYLACGDLLAAPGKLHEYYSSQWSYMSFQGHVNLLESLEAVGQLGVDVFLPGHGRPFASADAGIDGLSARLAELYELFHGQPYASFRPVFRRLSERVFEVSNSSANSYFVADGEGNGLCIDCGYVSGAMISANPHRFIDRLTPYLEQETGIRRVEWFLPSHYHDDHLAGLSALQLKYGTRVACSPEVADIIERPERYEMPCLVPLPAKVNRIVGRGEIFHWRGVDFRIEQFPGQTWYHHLITFEADGRRYLSIGDNISGLCFREQRDFIHSFIPKNRTPVSAYRDMPKQILERAPDTILTGHGGAVECERDRVERWQVWMDRWAELFEEIIAQPCADMGMDPHWIEFYPYKVQARPGEEVEMEVRVRNHEEEERACILRFRASGGARVEPVEERLELAAGEDGACRVRLTLPEKREVHAWTVAADVKWDGKALGEIAEGIVYW